MLLRIMANITILTRFNNRSEFTLANTLKEHEHNVKISSLYEYSYSGRILETNVSPYSKYPQENIIWQIPDSIFPAVEQLYKTIEYDQNFFNTSEAVSLTVNKTKRYHALTGHGIPTIFISAAIPGSKIPEEWAACKNYGGHEEEKILGGNGVTLNQNITDPWVTVPSFYSEQPIRVTIFQDEIVCAEQLQTSNGFNYTFKNPANTQQTSMIKETAFYTMKALNLNLAAVTVDMEMQTVINVETAVFGNQNKMEQLGHAIGNRLFT